MSGDSQSRNASSLKLLYQRWWFLLIASLTMLSAGFTLLWVAWHPGAALRWVIFPASISVYILAVLRRNLTLNHRPDDEQLLPSLGWGNLLTFTRALLIAALAGFLLLPHPQGWLVWIPGLLFVFADAADFFDGYLARITDHATRLGEVLDMSFDGLGVLVASMLALQYGQVPVWYVVVAFARPLFLAGMGLRRRLNLPLFDLPPSVSRRVFAGLQTGFLAAVLLPIFSPPLTYLAATLFGLPLLVGFFKDWLAVSGILRVQNLSARTRQLLTDWLPLMLRLTALVLNIAIAFQWVTSIEQPDPILTFVVLADFVLASFVILGALPRIAAMFALPLVGFFQILSSLTPLHMMLAVDYTALIYLGSGPFSLWTPDNRLFRGPVGGKSSAPLSETPLQPSFDKLHLDSTSPPVLEPYPETLPSLEGSI
jgi:CDP-diacylglycerol---glycerol-3-phosphate 3-phosphatidyltransferase